MELKTLKDLKRYCHRNTARKTITSSQNQIRVVDYNELKAEAVKWIKEDMKDFWPGKPGWERNLILKWMKRLDITEEDLK